MSPKSQVAAVDKAFKDISKGIEEASRRDADDISNNHGFWDQVGNILKNPAKVVAATVMMPVVGPAGTIIMIGVDAANAAHSAKQFHKQMHEAVAQLYKECLELWTPEVAQPGVGVRLTGQASSDLAARSETWKAEQTKALTSINDDLRGLEKPGEWKGADADAYHHAIPSQRAAVTDLTKLVADTATLYGQGGKGLGSALTGAQTTAQSVDASVSTSSTITPGDAQNWCTRLIQIKGHLETFKQDLTDSQRAIDGFLAQVAQQQRQLQQQMGSSPSIADGRGAWPVAKGDKRKLAPSDV